MKHRHRTDLILRSHDLRADSGVLVQRSDALLRRSEDAHKRSMEAIWHHDEDAHERAAAAARAERGRIRKKNRR